MIQRKAELKSLRIITHDMIRRFDARDAAVDFPEDTEYGPVYWLLSWRIYDEHLLEEQELLNSPAAQIIFGGER